MKGTSQDVLIANGYGFSNSRGKTPHKLKKDSYNEDSNTFLCITLTDT
jgi:hypothetical protein